MFGIPGHFRVDAATQFPIPDRAQVLSGCLYRLDRLSCGRIDICRTQPFKCLVQLFFSENHILILSASICRYLYGRIAMIR